MEIPSAVGSSSPPWIDLPADITASILRRLDTVEILDSAQEVCTTWLRVCQDPATWRVVDLYRRSMGNLLMCRLARRVVDLSRGELVELRIHDFGDVELLNYIVDRSRQLRCLTLDGCADMSTEALVEAVKKLPHLEELHLLNRDFPKPEDVAAIGSSCRSLKAFTLRADGPTYFWVQHIISFRGGFYCGDNAIPAAIATTMPNLIRLRLSGHCMEGEGLESHS